MSGMKGFPLKFSVKDYPKELSYDGFSDHSVGIGYAIEAISRGATILEKHFTFNKNSPGWDQPGSMTPTELQYIRQVSSEIIRMRNAGETIEQGGRDPEQQEESQKDT